MNDVVSLSLNSQRLRPRAAFCAWALGATAPRLLLVQLVIRNAKAASFQSFQMYVIDSMPLVAGHGMNRQPEKFQGTGGKQPLSGPCWSNSSVARVYIGGVAKCIRGPTALAQRTVLFRYGRSNLGEKDVAKLRLYERSLSNTLLALRTLRIGRGCWGGGGLFIPSDGFLHPLIFPLFLELLGLSVGHIAELLHPSGKHFRCEHAVVLIGGDPDQSLKLSWH